MRLPETTTLTLSQQQGVLHIVLDRPQARNAMSLEMVEELMTVFDLVESEAGIRALVLRGGGGHFCAGGDIKDMAGARQKAAEGDPEAFFRLNRRFGEMITRANRLPAVLITVLEGAVMGGGFGLACVSDVALAAGDARFALPETGLGVIPAQIAPFVVRRVGLTQARRLALTGARFDGHRALNLGVVHEVADSAEELDKKLAELLGQVRRCAPGANRATKALVLDVDQVPMEQLLDRAAREFADAVNGDEGQEGTLAFVRKRAPSWAGDRD
ncbi:enoyl-CoA hydratase-related protein [Alloalcanivorax profundimaris]|uniref:enoyl-CoA hydratase-related protein n=1 Tax=Alloalcanivorax profundimaris TaxID=2735259 RepID=UPI001886D94C|nr:enoyl-CoA hydratase-related protein [Alloalcanivorax profundimaris]MBF1801856.1 enoyl-CoA hydratase/isomerase family protein [Alloalcanivorax profundimaris]